MEAESFRITSRSAMEVSMFMPLFERKSQTGSSNFKPQRLPPQPPPLPPSDQDVSLYPKLDDTEPPMETHPDVEQPVPSLLSKFERLFHAFDYETTQKEILERRLIDCDFFTVLWRIFLHCLPRDPNQWHEMLSITRNQYTELRQKFDIVPSKISQDKDRFEIENHPLSQDKNSYWARYHENNDFKRTIAIDVRRTYPTIEFFRLEEIVELQVQVLFTHARHHEGTMPYRQGMHEILGIIVYKLHMESLRIHQDPQSNEMMKNLYDPQYIEHDAYTMFEKIMNHIRQFYISGVPSNPPLRKSPSMIDKKQQPFQSKNDPYLEPNETMNKMKGLFAELEKYDRPAYQKLNDLGIEATVFGIRWLRLLFGREIPFDSIPSLWTVIFCFDEGFTFVDHFFLALLMEFGQIKKLHSLVSGTPNIEHNECLHILMKQNVISDVEPVIRKALELAGRKVPPIIKRPTVPTSIQKPNLSQNPTDTIEEKSSQTSKLQRVPIVRSSDSRLQRPSPTNLVKPSDATSGNPLNGVSKSNIPPAPSTDEAASASKTSKNDPFEPLGDTESDLKQLELWLGKTALQKYQENVQLQKTCASYLQKFVGRLETVVCDLRLPNEKELFFKLSGLKRIADMLDGELPLDTQMLDTLLKDQSMETSSATNHENSSSEH